MSTAYWAQFDHSEIMSMHGVEVDEHHESDDDISCNFYDCKNVEEMDSCPRCSGGGCNYCLMLDW